MAKDEDKIITPLSDDNASRPLPLVPQFILDKGYQLKEQIGSGQFAKVYKATSNEFPNTIIACKRIEILSVDENWKENCLKQEMMIMKRLRHPHIVKVYDLIKTRRLVFIFMEFAENGNVKEQMEKAKRPYKESQAKLWFKQLFHALSYMHNKGIAHRDIKLDNVLINSKWDPLLSDFGFACITGDRNSEKIFRGTVCGTPVYMAPEVHIANDNSNYDAKAADVYSMGVCLFEMINYDKPFDEDLAINNMNKLYQLKIHRSYRYHRKLEPRLSDHIKDLINQLLEPKPHKRINAQQAQQHLALQQ